MNWFINPFLGSQVPITYEEETQMENEFTGTIERVIIREIIGYVFVDNLSKFMEDQQKIFNEYTIKK